MAGSRKGEKRGAAKGMRSTINGALGDAKVLVNSEKVKRTAPISKTYLAHEEVLFDLLNDRTYGKWKPKEALLKAMNYAFDMAQQYMQVMKQNELHAATHAVSNPKLAQLYEEAVGAAENRVMHYLQAGCNWAAQAAPYYHPRLSALVANIQGNDNGSFDAIRSILTEISDRERASPIIEHSSQEKVG